VPAFVSAGEQRVVTFGADELFATTVTVCDNWLGELSNMVLSAEGARHYPRPPAQGLNYFGLPDVGFLLEASRHLPLACVLDYLGVFRQHEQQTTHGRRSHSARIAFLCWIAYAFAAWQEGRITAAQAVNAIAVASQRAVQHLADDLVVLEYLALLEQHSGVDALCAEFTAFGGACWPANPRPDRSSFRPPERGSAGPQTTGGGHGGRTSI
jgi:hypothetical protein